MRQAFHKKTLFLLLATVLFVLPACSKSGGKYQGHSPLDPPVVGPVTPSGNFNVKGRVGDASTGKGVERVVVTDGTRCVLTDAEGVYRINSNVSIARFIYVSTPSGYQPPVLKGLPIFYKVLSSVKPVDGVYDMGDFSLTPVANPDCFTLLVTADPQPRSSSAGYDKFGYHSLDICEDLYKELKDVSDAITDRQVIGLCLGDIVHENMNLFANYRKGLSQLNYPTYNIIGNHDNDTSASDDDASAVPFESNFGPRYYSFNAGGVHFVVLDNLIMKKGSSGKLNAYDQGLTDEIWTWLQADMSYVPSSTLVMTASHSPMFKCDSGSERTNTAKHGGHTDPTGQYGYGDLFDGYDEVHAWAGHTHSSFNYVYPTSHRHKHVQVHTVARSTGELWTNEYLSDGTPRGFTVVEVDHGTVTWRFHPTRYQRPAWIGASESGCSVQPPYQWRDWNYDASGLAVMKDGGTLDEDYQLHVYPRGAYDDEYVYANVFLWDDKWQTPVFTPKGGAPVTMEKVTADSRHDLGTTEFRKVYKLYAPKLNGDNGYTAVNAGSITTLFRAPAPKSPSGGSVSVTDRFGTTYARNVNW